MLSVPDSTGHEYAQTVPSQSRSRKVDNPPTILQEAQAKVYGDREESYGHPREDFECQAAMMSPLLWRSVRVRARAAGLLEELDSVSSELQAILKTSVQPESIGSLMECVKLARWAHSPSRDTAVDRAGYAEADARLVGFDE